MKWKAPGTWQRIERPVCKAIRNLPRRSIILRYPAIMFSVLWLQLLAGCTVDNLILGLYNWSRVRNDLQSPPAERFGKPDSPDYREYERLRREQR